MRLRGKVAIITGAGSGIGRASAGVFAREGAKVVIAGRRAEPLRRAVEEIRSHGGEAMYHPTDVTQERSALYPLGLRGTPEDVAYAAVYLASEEAKWVTGIALPVDGGFILA